MNEARQVKTGDFLGKASSYAKELVAFLAGQEKTLVLAESCTAGLAADFIVRIPGASQVFWGSYVCYSELAKQKMLGISEELLQNHGAVSVQTALVMAERALVISSASLAVSITGLAGPSGDDRGTPVGTVWTACAWHDSQGILKSSTAGFLFDICPLSRNDVREAASAAAFEELLKRFQ